MALRAKFLQTLLAATLLLGASAACKKDVKKDRPGPDPDTNSGPDAKRGGAKPMTVNRSATDSVSWPKLQRTKWKRIDINTQSPQNILDCELHIDNTGADLNIDVFNSLGTQIGFSPGPAPNKLKQLAVQIDELGTYFVRVTATQPKDESDFSVQCNWEEQPQVVEPTKPVKPPRRGTKPTPTPKAPQTLEERIEKGLEGRVLQAPREGNVMKIYIDKGRSSNVREGVEGYVLEGPSGRVPLDGGAFKIIQVDENSSIGQSSLRSLGRKNNRVVLLDLK